MDKRLLSQTFVELADTLVADFDLVEFLHTLTDRAVPLLGASASGLMLADTDGNLRVVAASSEQARLLELFQLQADQGPCLDCYRTGRPVTVNDLKNATSWPLFIDRASAAGFGAVQALPMRLRQQIIGAMNLFRSSPGTFSPGDIRIGQAMADIATIGLLHQRKTRHDETLNDQLQIALNSRVIIEQAKGKLSERLQMDTDGAFNVLRNYARSRNLKLSEVAEAFVLGTDALPGIGIRPAKKRRG